MNVRREPTKAPGPQPRGGRGPAASGGTRPGDHGARSSGPGGRSWGFWRQAASIVLLAILALTGLAVVAMSSTGLLPALVFGVIIVALVVAVGITRAAR